MSPEKPVTYWLVNTKQVTASIATAQVFDACMRLKVPYRIAPAGMWAVVATENAIAGPAVPVRHYGSVDVFFEALERSEHSNGVMVIDNGRREDEACIGDLVVLEVKHAGLQGIVVSGLHRDSAELVNIGFPVFSYGTYPAGPSTLRSREPEAFVSARVGDFLVTADDTVFADNDGVIFLATAQVEEVVKVASAIRQTELKQAQLARNGTGLREQFQFGKYLQQRELDNGYTFRQHLASIARSVEE